METQISLSFKNFPEISFSAIVIPFIENKKSIKFIFVKLTDQTELLNEKERLNAEVNELRQFQSIIDSIVDPLSVIDKEGKIRYWNKPAQQLFGFTKSEIYGKSFSKILKTFDKNELQKIKEELIIIWCVEMHY